LEAEIGDNSEDNLVRIGKFVFLESTFNWGREQLQLSINNPSKYLVIDEIGPLELSGQGLEPVVTEIIQNREQFVKKNLILVVRENLLDQVISHYNLEGFIQTDHNFLSTP
jgi:nucleoside-triphosphatase THEP1